MEQEPRAEQLPGKIYSSTKELIDEMRSFEQSGSLPLRFWGRELVNKPSPNKPGKSYIMVEDVPNDPEAHFTGRIHKIDSDGERIYRIYINVFDKSLDQKGRPKIIYWFTIDDKNITDWQIEMILPKRRKLGLTGNLP